MKFLTPLGLLGLLGIVVLIIIWIIKPNYQTKRISSTYIWKLSLKYKKKRIPINKLRSLLLFLCQLLALTACAFVLAQPNKVLREQVDSTEVVAIIDSSASMLTQLDEKTRFERAVKMVIDSYEKLPIDGFFSVIMADENPTYLFQRITKDDSERFNEIMTRVLYYPDEYCSYGSADMSAAMELCGDVLYFNPNAAIILYTDAKYSYVPKTVSVIPVSSAEEWNAAILNATAEIVDNYYEITVQVACYGADAEITLNMDVQDFNGSSEGGGSTLKLFKTVECTRDVVKTIVFKSFSEGEEVPDVDSNIEYYPMVDGEQIHQYSSIILYLDEDDSFLLDNTFNIYDGQKPTINIRYVSTIRNPFMYGMLDTIQKSFVNRWTIEVDSTSISGQLPTSGYDFYIFEHVAPERMPEDGVVLLVNPPAAPVGSGFTMSNSDRGGNGVQMPMAVATAHAITRDVLASDMTVSRYRVITTYDAGYQVLMTVNGTPVMMVKDDGPDKVFVMGFSLHYSNLPLSKDFPLLMYDMFDYFFPATVESNSYSVYERVALSARGYQLKVQNGDFEQIFSDFPATLVVDTPGTYVLNQTTFWGTEITERIYVKIPSIESNIFLVEDRLEDPFAREIDDDFYSDLLMYIAIALLVMLLAEWLLHSKEES